VVGRTRTYYYMYRNDWWLVELEPIYCSKSWPFATKCLFIHYGSKSFFSFCFASSTSMALNSGEREREKKTKTKQTLGLTWSFKVCSNLHREVSMDESEVGLDGWLLLDPIHA